MGFICYGEGGGLDKKSVHLDYRDDDMCCRTLGGVGRIPRDNMYHDSDISIILIGNWVLDNP